MLPDRIDESQNCVFIAGAGASVPCGLPVEHVIPAALDGPTELANLALACQQCNARKWMHAKAVDRETGERVSLFNPRTQVWEEHFRWADDDAAILEPLTVEARATLELLELSFSQTC